MKNQDPRSPCPVACTLDLLGDKWSLLVVRDLFEGKKRFGDFVNSREGIPTNILTNRLKRLTEVGIVEKRWYSERPPRAEYVLTEKGLDLRDVVLVMFRWGMKHVPGTRQNLPPAASLPPRLG